MRAMELAALVAAGFDIRVVSKVQSWEVGTTQVHVRLNSYELLTRLADFILAEREKGETPGAGAPGVSILQTAGGLQLQDG